MSSESSIGIFDSGFGGLTVLKAMIQLLPEESYTYLGDSARLPYGNKSPKTIEKYLQQNIQFLKTQNVKAIIVACNSASSVLPNKTDFGIPVLGVINPGAQKALSMSKNKKIGIIATRATVQQGSYITQIHKINPDVEIYQQACPLFVPLVEEGLENDPLTSLVVHRYLSPLLSTEIDTLILGCTHYPVLKETIQKVVRHRQIEIVDSGQSIAPLIKQKIEDGEIERNHEDTTFLKVLATDTNSSFIEVAERILAPQKISNIHHVNISPL